MDLKETATGGATKPTPFSSQRRGSRAYEKRLPEGDVFGVVDFFSGCGGMSAGFADTRQSHSRFDVLAGIDIDGIALTSFEANIGAPGVVSDVRDLARDPALLTGLVPAVADFQPDRLVFLGCAPCQGFSAHRKKDPRVDARNDLMMAFAEIVAYWRPAAVVMENVPEILSNKFAQYFGPVRDRLSDAGYVVDARTLDFSEFGLPQRRRRALVIASRFPFEFPRPPVEFALNRRRTVRDAIAHLPPLAAGEVDSADPWHRAPAHTERILERIRATPPDGGDRRALRPSDQLECHRTIDAGSTPGFTDVYGRLRWDRPSVTITAKSSSPSCGRFLHPAQDRNITPREAALLQGFPAPFQFLGPFTNQFRQIGEAVPPLVARFIASSVLDALAAPPAHRRGRRGLPARPSGQPISAVDIFCGAGGLSLGLAQAGLKTAVGIDLDADAIATFQNALGVRGVVANVQDASSIDLIDSVTAAAGEWVLAGGPPCQGFSQQRRGSDADERNDLVLSMAHVVSEVDVLPAAVILENVTYLDSPRGRAVLSAYIDEMATLGFETVAHELNSADFGVAQTRRRIFLVSLPDDVASRYRGPSPTSADRWPTVGEVLDGLPPAAVRGEELMANHYLSAETESNRQRIAFVGMGEGRLSIPEELQLPCHRKYGGHLDVYGRLDWFGQARTITGGFDSFTRGEFAHPFWNRSITPREAARLQGFPDHVSFVGNRASVRRQIGNAVPPPLAEAVGRAVREAIVVARRVSATPQGSTHG